jgi:hypothetical protein
MCLLFRSLQTSLMVLQQVHIVHSKPVVSSDLRFIRHKRTPIKSNQIKTLIIKES